MTENENSTSCAQNQSGTDGYNRLDKLKEVLRKENLLGWQVFDCVGIAGDYTDTVYNEDGVIVEVSEYYEYVEILGLSKKEFQSLIKKKDNGIWYLKKDL